MFGPLKSKQLAGIVTITSPSAARKAAQKLADLFRHARTRPKKVHIKRSAVLAANRAGASAKRRGVSAKERKELKQVAGIYRRAADRMKL